MSCYKWITTSSSTFYAETACISLLSFNVYLTLHIKFNKVKCSNMYSGTIYKAYNTNLSQVAMSIKEEMK